MAIEYKLTEADILALARYRLQHSPSLRRRLRIQRLGYTFGFGLLAVGLWLTSNTILAVAFLTLAIISFLFFPTYYDWRLRRSVSQAYQNEKKQVTLGTRTLRATDEGLEEESSFGEIKIKWDFVDDIIVTPTHTFISIEQLPSVVIPKDQVKERYDEFISTCRNYKDGNAGQ